MLFFIIDDINMICASKASSFFVSHEPYVGGLSLPFLETQMPCKYPTVNFLADALAYFRIALTILWAFGALRDYLLSMTADE